MSLFAFIWSGPSEAKIKVMIFIATAVRMPGLLRDRTRRELRKLKNIRRLLA